MNLATITKPNVKGQIVIPKKFRDELSIDENVFLSLVVRGGGVLVTPLSKAPSTTDSRKISLEILKKTAGSWNGDDWENVAKRRTKTELVASNRRKKIW